MLELYQHVINQVLLGAGCTGFQNISGDMAIYGKDVAEHDEKAEKGPTDAQREV